MNLALYQPDIPQNVGAIIRLAACLDVTAHLVEPFGFLWEDARLRRAGMDYRDLARVVRHPSWAAFQQDRPPGRLVLLTTKASQSPVEFAFRPGDTLLLGRESAGVPDEVHQAVDARLRIPMAEGARSLNVAVSAALVLGEALRQTDGYPSPMTWPTVSR
jgi:tRNA (cytidine/uridine-2'-O-)-methyltransferase